MFTAVDIITTKRDGHALTAAQITWMVNAYTAGEVSDEQFAALAMAIYFRGLNDDELFALTTAMLNSGATLNFSDLGKPTADKHSTGGVGDKITLPLTPLVASYGVAVPQLSGRGLGHTGGTLDKLESIPGFIVELTEAHIRNQLRTVGGVICAATGQLAPADKKIYALRDVTATVDSMPLIASSIMSKKLAEGTDTLVLDVKTGTGAFMQDQDAARQLAEKMVWLGKEHGVATTAVLTRMDTPLGSTVGNAMEVEETLEVLAGGGPDDVVELTLTLAQHMLAGAGIDADPAEHLVNGKAMDTWRAIVAAQFGDPDAQLPTAPHEHTVVAPETGVLTRMDARAVGEAAWRLGAGRQIQGQPVQATAGIRLHAKPGERITAGQPLMTLYTETEDRIPAAQELLESALDVAETFHTPDLIIDVID
ncbi:MAG TPA: thymidine phosphorylase [Enteractinococcus helveticum]|uniref:Thymidine phosphorylase n=1 Tax=Enteractinococcus helveticum TaxID=1837282 RepID=A0A921FM23_9MICC|nr:thymidine phosphorylase [Enteractinococcus helveticum]HJF13226.1 thymidine phosphorylase [Enteractinococcus helveticum]